MNTQNHSEHYTAEQKRLEAKYPIIEGYDLQAVSTQLRQLKDECKRTLDFCDRAMEAFLNFEGDEAAHKALCQTLGACIERFNTLQKHYNENGYKVLAYRDKFTSTPHRVEVYAPKGDGYLAVG